MMLPVPTLSATIDARGNVTIAGWSPPARPRADTRRAHRGGWDDAIDLYERQPGIEEHW